jgi:BioD-like phosphotransacetylase family protein
MDLYVASWEKGGGKTTLCAGIGRWLKESGAKVGYLTLAGKDAGRDAEFMKLALGLEESLGVVAPHSGGESPDIAGGRVTPNIKEWRDTVAAGRDLVIIEGVGGMGADEMNAEATIQTLQDIRACTIVVISYANKIPLDRIGASLRTFGENLLGVVINRVPGNRMETARTEIADMLDRQGTRTLCLLPEDRILFGVSVGELAEQLQAEAVCCKDRLEDLVQNVMIGVLTADSGRDYFVRKDHKAVITRGERPDMQLAALSTPTAALILTGGTGPIPQVKAWAEEKHVPILVTKTDTMATASEVERAFVDARFRHEAKLTRLEEILRKGFDFSALLSGLGLAG